MKTSHLILAALLAPIPASVLVSCAQINSAMNTVGLGIGAKQTLETDVDDLRSMRSELEASWAAIQSRTCLLYTSPSPRDLSTSRMPSSA